MVAQNNAAGGKGPCSGQAGGGGKGEGMVRTAGPNHPGGQPPIDKIRRLQRKLYGAAKQQRERRFHALYDRVHRSDVLWEAWSRVRRNKGAAGVDGITLEAVEKYGVARLLAELGHELHAGTYQPPPVLRRYIPKADGKLRPLGIPTVKDRIAQMAMKLVIEPIFEADFKASSFGFRPRRSALQALETIREVVNAGCNHVLDADIRDYFGSIDQVLLMQRVERRISDRRVLKLLRSAACNDVHQAGGSPAAAVARFGRVAMPDIDSGRPGLVQAQAKVLKAAARWSDPSGGRAKTGAAAEREHCSVEKLSHEKRVVGCRAAEPFAQGRRPMDDSEGNGPVQLSSAPAYGWWHQRNGECSKAGMVSTPESPVHKPLGEASGDVETGGSGRSSEDAEGQHNPGGAKDPWDSGVPAYARTAPTCQSANGDSRSCSRGGHYGSIKPDAWGRVRLEQEPAAVLKPYWGKPAVRNFRGAWRNGARQQLHGHEAGNGGDRQADAYWPSRAASTQQWLQAGVMDEGRLTETVSGTPQGGVISPLLSNVYLDFLDTVWERQCAGIGKLVRYADDFVVLCRNAEEAERRVRIIFDRLKLTLHPEKTQKLNLTDGQEGFDFLGCHLHKRLSGRLLAQKGVRRYYLQRWPSVKSMRRVREKVRVRTDRSHTGVKDVRVIISDLNPVLHGWGNYFCTGNASRKFNQLDEYVFERLHRFMLRRHGRNLRAGRAEAWTRKWFWDLGLHRMLGTVRYPKPCTLHEKTTVKPCAGNPHARFERRRVETGH